MTSAILKAQIAHAKARSAAGDCDGAEQILNEAWVDLGNYSRALAARGRSPASALSMHRLLTKAHAQIRKRCLELIQPTYRSRGAPAGLIAPTFAPVHNPDLLAPSFSGAGDLEPVMWGAAVLGVFAVAVLGLGLGKMHT